MLDNKPTQWHRLIGRISNYSDSAKGHEREIAAIRRGSSQVTESFAYPYVLPYADGLNETQKTALLRVAALLAEYRDIPSYQHQDEQQKTYRSFGAWCYQLSSRIADEKQVVLNPDKPDVVGSRLAYLHTQPLEEAAQSIRRLLALADGLQNPPALDKQGIARTLIYWGNGISPESQRVRQRILRDYYSSFTYAPSASNEDSSSNIN